MPQHTYDTDLAWAAGIMEGEGFFSIAKEDKNAVGMSTCVGLTMTDHDVISRLAAILSLPAPIPQYPPSTRKRGYQPFWASKTSRWVEVNRICLLLYPYMGERRRHQIANVLEVNQLRKEMAHPKAAWRYA